MQSNFDKYYDLIFSQKKYKKEVLYILKNTRTTRPKKILDVGCGTGTHSDLIYRVRKTKIIALDTNKSAIKIANKELGGLWRLPTLKELESLVCQECSVPKIDKVVFPNTLAEPYWTSEKNWVTSQNIWSVNFMTGFSYGRFFPYQSLAVRLVKGL